MKYSDSLYLSRFAVDPELEYVGDDILEDFNSFEAAYLENLDNEIYPDSEIDTGLE